MPRQTFPDLERLANDLKQRIESRRSVGKTVIVAKDHIVEPPFEVEYSISDEIVSISIKGSSGEFRTVANDIVMSRFRNNQISFLLFDKTNILESSCNIAFLTEAYQQILESFPPGCEPFKSDTLYEKVVRSDGKPQAHARRRWKELKYNYGFDVDFDQEKQLYYRGSSPTPINQPDLRPDDKKIREEFLGEFQKVGASDNSDEVFFCNYCECSVYFKEIDSEGISIGLLDHRRPIFQGGGDTLENLQVFCQTCNNKKNSSCRKCREHNCDKCVWAFPEAFKNLRVILHLTEENLKRLQEKIKHLSREEIAEILRGVSS